MKSLGHSLLLVNPGRRVLHDDDDDDDDDDDVGRMRVILAETACCNFVIFWYTSIATKLDDKVYILLFNSYEKFHAKVCTRCGDINKSRNRLLFMFTLWFGLVFCSSFICIIFVVSFAPARVVVSVTTSRSQDGLEMHQRLVSVSSREKLSTSRSREADVSVSSRSRPFTSCVQDQFSAKLCRPQYAVWTDFRRCKPML